MKVKELKAGVAYAKAGYVIKDYVRENPRHWSTAWEKVIVLDPHYWSKVYSYTVVGDTFHKGRHPNTRYLGYGVPVARQLANGVWFPDIVPSNRFVVEWDAYEAATAAKRAEAEAKEKAAAQEQLARESAVAALRTALSGFADVADNFAPYEGPKIVTPNVYDFGVTFGTVTSIEWLTSVLTVVPEMIEAYKDYLYEMED